MKKRIFFVINLIAIFLAFFACIKGVEADKTERETLTVCVSEEDSMATDKILRYALNNLGYNVSITSAKMTTAMMSVNNGTYDILAVQCLSPTLAAQYQKLIKVEESIEKVAFTYYGLKDKAIPDSLNWNSILDYEIGCEYERPYIEEKVENISVKRYKSKQLLMNGLLDNDFELAIIPIVSNAHFYMNSLIEAKGVIEEVEVFSYVNSSHRDLVDDLENEYRAMKENGILDSIIDGSYTEEDNQLIVLNLTSYDSQYETVKVTEEAMKNVLSKEENIRIYTMYLNANNSDDMTVRNKMKIDTLRSDFGTRLPDVVVASNRYALQFIKDYYHIIFNEVPIIYTGVGEIESSGFDDFIYIKQEIEVEAVIDLAIKLFPNTTGFFILNDYMLDGKEWRRIIEEKTVKYQSKYNITYNSSGNIDDLIEELKNLDKNTIILSGLYTSSTTNRFLVGEQLINYIRKNYHNPVMSWNLSGLTSDEVGGKYIDQNKIGEYIANIILNIKKTSLNELDIISSYDLNTWEFNYDLLKKYSISVKSLPSGSKIINPKLGLKDANPTAYYLLLSTIGTLSVGVIIAVYFVIYANVKNRKILRVQKSLVDAEEIIKKEREINIVKERFNTIVKDAPVAFVIADKTGKIIQTNDYAANKIGFKIGANVIDYDSEKESHLENLSKLRDSGNISDVLVDYLTSSGSTEKYLINIKRFEDESEINYIVWGINVEELNNQRIALLQAQKNLTEIIDLLPWPMAIVDPITKKMIYINEIYKYKFTNVKVMENFYSIFPDYQSNGESSIEKVERFIEKLYSSKEASSEEIEHIVNDKIVTMKCYGTNILYDGKAAISVVLDDIEAQKQQELLLTKAALKEKEANQMKSKFIMNMSHEIRTPMNAIIGISDVQLLKSNPNEIQDAFRKINLSSKLLLNIINDILDFSKIEADKLEVVDIEFNLEDIISNALLTSSQKIGNKKVEMLLDMDTSLPRRLSGDETRVWQVIKNILDNSAKFTEKGRVVLKVSRIESEDCKILFEITDTGKGMSKEELERIFKPFEQFGSKISKANGTGLGMSITKHLIELMNGSIDIESEIGKGTTTRIIIPFREITIEKIIDFDEIKVLEDKNILIIDDDEVASTIMDVLLTNAGAKPTVLNYASKVIDKIKTDFAANKTYDLILIDYMLDEGTGIDLARELNKYIGENTKLLMVSNYVKNMNNLDLSLFKEIIDKPFVPTQFLNTINRALSINKIIIPKNKNQYVFPNANILVFEDNYINQGVIIDILEYFKVNVDIAENGVIGLEKAKNNKYDLILMDILMPIMDGHEATKNIRSHQDINQNTPIIAMTANTMKSEMDLCLEEGMNGYVSKPINIDKLYEYLVTYLPSEINPNLDSDTEIELSPEFILLKNHGIEVVSGINRFGNKMEQYKNSLIKFSNRMIKEIDEKVYVFKDTEEKELASYIHALKGVTGNLSMKEIHQKLINFEKNLREQIINYDEYNFIIKNIKELCISILNIFNNEDNSKELGDRNELEVYFESLKKYLNLAHAKEVDKYVDLIKSKSWKTYNEIINKILHEIDSYDYDSAIIIIDQFLQKK